MEREINRIRMSLPYCKSVQELRANFSHMNDGDFFLAYKAALQMEKNNV